MRILGLDYGARRIGIALTDELLIAAHAREALVRTTLERDLETIRNIVREDGVSEIVIGLPVMMDGRESAKAAEVREFIAHLQRSVAVPVRTFDERLTTVLAEKILLEGDLSRRKRKGRRDGLAAQIILEGYLAARKKG